MPDVSPPRPAVSTRAGWAHGRFAQLLELNAHGATAPAFDATLARRLLGRIGDIPFFAHSYSLIQNLDCGSWSTSRFAEHAYVNGLHGLCLHRNDGGATAIGRMSGGMLDTFRRQLQDLGLKLHLEISSSDPEEVQRAVESALALGVTRIRLYARYEGPLAEVLDRIYADLSHAAELANRHDLHFDYEQHEDLRASEIADVLRRVGDPRVNALFDYTNSLNAHEEPLDALRILAPYIRQVHIKGGRKVVTDKGWGQLGVAQGAPEDELPGNRMLFELLMLGHSEPQVACFALEQEVGYSAPPFRLEGEGTNPFIRFRDPSITLRDPDVPLERALLDEWRLAIQQVTWNRAVVAAFREVCLAMLEEGAPV